jgi:solute carrier family 5 (sodium-coupled monocarboxylate transporter), member 8/12
LSSLSTGLNSMSAVVLEDFFKPFAKNGISERKTALIMRGTVLVLGVLGKSSENMYLLNFIQFISFMLAVALVYVVQHMGSVLQLSMSLPTACFGPMLGVYIVGLGIPWVGKKAVLISAFVSCFSMILLVFKAQAEIALGNIKFETKPLVTDGCTYNFTIPDHSNITDIPLFSNGEREKHIYDISYLYYTFLGSSIVVVTSIILSFFFGFQDPAEIDPRLLAPFLRKFIRSQSENVSYKDKQGNTVYVHKFDSKQGEKEVEKSYK